ncbi:alpha/beta fold hydrolase [Synechococcus sp. PCC 6312]|uniref:alpha/beta fold hydrolase n=1 Tax=Synechococcus sp. (strain ATCC 27167 / PCC 6312) TaxID=195253 RepID=UPI00029F3BF2|nr:alpha/beta hydrolase [Synechococcus sp. PCC 6312]AFY62027.1 putative hydrolase or acyltransferase of alpha/beta superfamily [Synechococcus sp. PCC 6312]
MELAPGFSRQSLLTDLGRVAYARGGPEITVANTPLTTLLFLHGFGGGSSSYEWSLVYPAFAAHYRIIAPDLIGWGDSEHPRRDYTDLDYLQLLETLISHFAETGPIVVIASSLTAGLVIRAAIAIPEKLQALILFHPSGLSDFGQDFRDTWLAQLIATPGLDQLVYRFGIATEFGIQTFMAQRQFANPDQIAPAMVKAYLRSAEMENADCAALAFVRGDLCFDLADYLPTLTTPTFFIWGSEAQLSSLSLGQELAKLNPQAIQEFITLPNVGITPQLEVPAVTIGLIHRCLGKIEGLVIDIPRHD